MPNRYMEQEVTGYLLTKHVNVIKYLCKAGLIDVKFSNFSLR